MKGATLFLILLGLIVAAFGGVFTVLLWNSYQSAVDQRSWPKVEAVVLSSEAVEYQHDEFSPKEYQLEILYGYEWKGDRMTGERYEMRGNPKYKDRAKIERLAKSLPAGKRTRIFVDPEDPTFTILKLDTKAAGYSIWFPLLFVAGGLGIAVRAVWNCRVSSEQVSKRRPKIAATRSPH
jgi:hypothetical protein